MTFGRRKKILDFTMEKRTRSIIAKNKLLRGEKNMPSIDKALAKTKEKVKKSKTFKY